MSTTRPTSTHGDHGNRSGGGQGGRPPSRVRRSLERFDRYTLDVFNPGASTYRSRADRPA